MRLALMAVLACAAMPVLAQSADDLPIVTLAQAETAEMRAQVRVSGTLVARQVVQVYPQVSGFEIRELLVEAGDHVSAGQPLARLSDDTLRAQLAQAEAEFQRAQAARSQAQSQIASTGASLAQAQAALDRVQRLKRSGNASQAALDQAVSAEAGATAAAASARDGLAVAEAALAQAGAARDLAQLNLDRSVIAAPVSGVVSQRNAEQGALATGGGEPMFTLIRDGEIEMEGEVIETALPALKPGAPARISVAGTGQIDGKLRLVPARVDPVTRLGQVRIALTQSPGLRPGLFASGWIVTQTRQAVTVPLNAVLSDEQGDRVQVVKDGVIHTRPVTAGLIWEGRREIRDGLAEGESVVARSGAFFRDGDKVRSASQDGSSDAGSGQDAAKTDGGEQGPASGDAQ
ncbi:efflux RND transporter periplasmic adaptor subunit [Paracoccus jiaweipingae]|uniref:efflux RND transporter periplasmic adaptor subunit n=1 Tax=unclassified Paracoccus (in: a-proteobacteria) TaxID=2688777 RepID=UPI003793AF43